MGLLFIKIFFTLSDCITLFVYGIGKRVKAVHAVGACTTIKLALLEAHLEHNLPLGYYIVRYGGKTWQAINLAKYLILAFGEFWQIAP